MRTVEAHAPAKVNLTLHVTGLRQDGYHLLHSLVVFADISDRITARPAKDLSLTVDGPFQAGVPTDGKNLVLRAAKALQQISGATTGAAIHLQKNLPHAAGIGSGSSDAAAAIRLLSDLWGVDVPPTDQSAILSLGADVPVCLAGPAPQEMSGIGEILRPTPPLPNAALVLVNPRVEVPTGAVFAGLQRKDNPAMHPLPSGLSPREFADWLTAQRNDLYPPANVVAPVIGQTLDLLQQMPETLWAGMSGSGATCVALVSDMGAAQNMQARIASQRPDWWVGAGALLGPKGP